MEKIQFGGLAVVLALFGTVIGSWLKIAEANHGRIEEPSTIFQLPEGCHGILVGSVPTARVGRLIGADRMTEMVLNVGKYNAN